MSIQASEHPICGTRVGENHKITMPSSDWCTLIGVEPHCHSFHIFYGCMGKVWQVLVTINTPGSCSSKPQITHMVGPDLVRTVKQWCHPQGRVCCYTKNHSPWMGYHPFHMFYRCMYKVWQAWAIINTIGSWSYGIRFDENCKTTKQSSD